jgi:NAD(P)-dependent dehydrogenase (short-subunit alcohol dehydrogenase family)
MAGGEIADEFAVQVVVVTGAASGIGRGVATSFLQRGARLVAADVDQAGLTDFHSELKSLGYGGDGAHVDTACLDVSDASAVGDAVSAIEASHGRVDILVNAAGISTMQPVETLPEMDWDRVMDVNAKGVFLMTRAVLPGMLRRRAGCIVNIASAAGKRGSRMLSHYAASKFAVVGFTQSVALETAAHGIRVNAVCPGLIETPMQEREIAWEMELRGISGEAVRERYLQAVPMQRLGTPADVAGVVLFLCSAAAGYVTGESINVGGGYIMD